MDSSISPNDNADDNSAGLEASLKDLNLDQKDEFKPTVQDISATWFLPPPSRGAKTRDNQHRTIYISESKLDSQPKFMRTPPKGRSPSSRKKSFTRHGTKRGIYPGLIDLSDLNQSLERPQLNGYLPGIDNFKFGFTSDRREEGGKAEKNKISKIPDEPFRFLDLPFDVRKIVYIFLFCWEFNVKYDLLKKKSKVRSSNERNRKIPSASYGPPCPVAFMQTCRVVYHEAVSTLYGSNCFVFNQPKVRVSSSLPAHAFFSQQTYIQHMKNFIDQRLTCSATELIGEGFPSQFAKVLEPLRLCPMLINERFIIFVRNDPALAYDEILSHLLTYIDDLLANPEFSAYELGTPSLVKGECNGPSWIHDHSAWTICLNFVRKGYSHPQAPKPFVPIGIQQRYGGWESKQEKIRGVECTVWESPRANTTVVETLET